MGYIDVKNIYDCVAHGKKTRFDVEDSHQQSLSVNINTTYVCQKMKLGDIQGELVAVYTPQITHQFILSNALKTVEMMRAMPFLYENRGPLTNISSWLAQRHFARNIKINIIIVNPDEY